jgi:deoxyadenosine/deoxycytidine kinase
MNKLIVVVGNSGVGKTTLFLQLCRTAKFVTGFEQHIERPYQALFKRDPRYALANQIDYLLLRAEQEGDIRQSSHIGLQDGGLDMDFFRLHAPVLA